MSQYIIRRVEDETATDDASDILAAIITCLKHGTMPPRKLAWMYLLDGDGEGYVMSRHCAVYAWIENWGNVAFCPVNFEYKGE